jgi:hypothetical protein
MADATDDLIDAASLGPLRRKLTEYNDKIDNASDKVRDAWRGSPLKRAIDSASDAYTKYTSGNKKKVAGGDQSSGYTAKSTPPKKKTPQRKRVATKR